eukprot:g5060.t1
MSDDGWITKKKKKKKKRRGANYDPNRFCAPEQGVPDGKKSELQNRWAILHQKHQKRSKATSLEDWSASIKHIYSFGTVEDMWSIVNNIRPPTTLNTGDTYYIFKEGIVPSWENDVNKEGGKWTVVIGPGTRIHLDQMWLLVILGLVGETLDDGDEICGAVLSVRKQYDRIALWTRHAKNVVAQAEIGRRLKALLQLPEEWKISYSYHDDSLRVGSGMRTQAYYEV